MRTIAILGAAAAAALAAGCGGGTTGTDDASTAPAPSPKPAPAAAGQEPAASQEPLRHAQCPAAASNCRTAEGTILYVERVDPDGDGDAHFVLLSRDSVSGPGLSVIDVERSLRPHPLPAYGDRVSAAGAVYRGHYGQRQIQATEVFTAPG